ncbi:MAG: hypothetical protein ACT4QC_19945 [Planctomycetaceae bacterium]
MTRFSRILTVLVTALSVGFMAVAAAAVAVSTDWKARLNEFPKSKITAQQQKISELSTALADTERAQKAWVAGVDADVKALADPNTGREAQLEARLNMLNELAHKLFEQIEVAARQEQAKLDELKLRREDKYRLEAQYDEIVSQKQAALADVRRLRDLLVQAEGMLKRVQERNKSLHAEARDGHDGLPEPPAQD